MLPQLLQTDCHIHLVNCATTCADTDKGALHFPSPSSHMHLTLKCEPSLIPLELRAHALSSSGASLPSAQIRQTWGTDFGTLGEVSLLQSSNSQAPSTGACKQQVISQWGVARGLHILLCDTKVASNDGCCPYF